MPRKDIIRYVIKTLTHGIFLTPRDYKIIRMVYAYDGLLSYQIRRRFWPRPGARSACFARLSRLIAAGFLRRKRLESPSGKGSGPSLITIGSASHPILKLELGLTGTDIRRLRHAFVPLLWLHEAAVRDFRLTLELACEASGRVTLVEWQNEADLRRTPINVKVGTTAVDLVPDGLFTLGVGERRKRYFLELDRATEMAPQRWKSRVKAYLHHIGREPTPVLIVVPHQQRADQLARWTQEVTAEIGGSSALFAIARRENVRENTILDVPIWQVVGEPGPVSLLPPPAVPAAQPPAAPTGSGGRPTSWAAFLLGEEMTRA